MYYDGRPIVADAVFDELELRLRQMRSSVVRKYPRCSLHRSGPMYADADEDPSQQWALRCIWRVLAAGGMALTSIPLATAIHAHLATTPGSMSAPPSLAMAAASLLSLAVGFPVVSTCLEACRKMSSGHTHAVRGQCPSCGEDVFAFLSSEGRPVRPDGRAFLREHAECHVCDQKLEFRAFFVNRWASSPALPLPSSAASRTAHLPIVLLPLAPAWYLSPCMHPHAFAVTPFIFPDLDHRSSPARSRDFLPCPRSPQPSHLAHPMPPLALAGTVSPLRPRTAPCPPRTSGCTAGSMRATE